MNKIDGMDMLEALFASMNHSYFNQYKIGADSLMTINQHPAPNVRRLGFNLSKYRKIAHKHDCVVCGKTAETNTVIAVPAGVHTEYDLPVVLFLCKKHGNVLIKRDATHKDMAKINDAFLAIVDKKTKHLPANSFYDGHHCYPTIEELVSPSNSQIIAFIKSKKGVGYVVDDRDCRRFLYCTNKEELLKYYTGWDDFKTKIVLEKTSKTRAEWTILGGFFQDEQTPPELITAFPNGKRPLAGIMTDYWAWVEADINARNGTFLDLSDSANIEEYYEYLNS